FLDTFKFMASPLVNLVQNLKEFPCLSEYFLDKDFLTQKGIYPYDYMDSFERFNETQLPSKENFYNKLNNSHISDKDYVHAQNVWEKYNIKNLGEYHDLYLKTDVLLLADVFEAFRKESSYLMYYDANNLYGWAMSQALPYGKLRWVKEKDYKNVLQERAFFLAFDSALFPHAPVHHTPFSRVLLRTLSHHTLCNTYHTALPWKNTRNCRNFQERTKWRF
uniref:uncharacterized protein n=1 Tax=Myxine glutinosa TaxID=7769 RepID=UPI00358EE190